MRKPRPAANCHPDKPHYAHGLCSACYLAWHRVNRKDRDAYLQERCIYEQHNRRRRFYGLSKEEYEKTLKEQHGVCAICKRPPHKGFSLSVDHNHKTGTVRGLLCHDCNRGIGMFKDGPELFENVIKYLKKYGG